MTFQCNKNVLVSHIARLGPKTDRVGGISRYIAQARFENLESLVSHLKSAILDLETDLEMVKEIIEICQKNSLKKL